MKQDSESNGFPTIGSKEHASPKGLVESNAYPHLRNVQGRKAALKEVQDWLKTISADLVPVGVAGLIDLRFLCPSMNHYLPANFPDSLKPVEDDERQHKPPVNIQPVVVRARAREDVHPQFPAAVFEVLSGLEHWIDAIRLETKEVFVVVVDVSDQEAARALVHGRPLKAYELVYLVVQLLAEKVFETQKALAIALDINESEVSKAMALNRIPPAVLEAFPVRTELRYRDGPKLEKAWKNDPDDLLARAAEAKAKLGTLNRLEVLAMLLNLDAKQVSDEEVSDAVLEVTYEGVPVFVIQTNGKGETSIKPVKKKLSPQAIDLLKAALEKLTDSDGEHFVK